LRDKRRDDSQFYASEASFDMHELPAPFNEILITYAISAYHSSFIISDHIIDDFGTRSLILKDAISSTFPLIFAHRFVRAIIAISSLSLGYCADFSSLLSPAILS